MTKLQNYFKDYLPLIYRDFRLARATMTAKQSVVAELLRVCCEEDDVKAMKLAFERILGKPEKVVVIKRTLARTYFPDATTKELEPPKVREDFDRTVAVSADEAPVTILEADAPSVILRGELDLIGEMQNQDVYEVIENKDNYPVAHVFAANVYATAMRGGNLGAIDLLFNHLDGAVADVIRVEGTDTILIENYADTAPYDAKQDEQGIWYIETEAVS